MLRPILFLATLGVAMVPLAAAAQPQPTPQPQPQPQPQLQPQPQPQPQPTPQPQLQPQPQPQLQPQPYPQPQPGPVIVAQPGGTTIYTAPGYGTPVFVQAPPGSMEWVRPDRLAYEPGEVIPNGYADRSSQNLGLFVGGLSLFGGVYFPTLITGLTLADDDVGTAALAAPVIGPLIAIGTIEDVEGAGAYGLVLDFIGQASGVVMFAVSFATQQHMLRRVGGVDPSGTVHVGVGPGGGSLSVSF